MDLKQNKDTGDKIVGRQKVIKVSDKSNKKRQKQSGPLSGFLVSEGGTKHPVSSLNY